MAALFLTYDGCDSWTEAGAGHLRSIKFKSAYLRMIRADGPMDEEFTRNAVEAERWASRCRSQILKDGWLRIAAGWRSMIIGPLKRADLIDCPRSDNQEREAS
jgi:hypothetical protein